MAELLRLEMDSFEDNGNRIDTLIDMTPLKGIRFEEIIRNVDKVWSLVMKGAHRSELHIPLEMEGFSKSARDVILDMALTRKRSHEKYERGNELFFTSEGLRWATPQAAADHCSARMGRDLVIDATCGQGGQVISLADHCEQVIGIDLDPLNCLVTILNCRAMDKKNVQVINGNCLDPDIIKMSEEGCAVFCDPARPPGAVERTLEEIIPDPREIKDAYGESAKGMCFELPPYISTDKVDFQCEYEFLSIDGRLNRLNIYTGDLITAERSAVALPDGNALKGIPAAVPGIRESDLENGNLIYEVDPAVVRAGLEYTLAAGLQIDPDFIHLDGRRCLLASPSPLTSSFLRKGYRILASRVSDEDLIRTLKELDAGSVTLRYGVDPKDYWKQRRSLEAQLKGSRKVDLFRGEGLLVLERL